MYHNHPNRVCIYTIQMVINNSFSLATIDLIAHTKTWFPSHDSNMQLGFFSVDLSCVLFINPVILPVIFYLSSMHNVAPLF